MSSSASQALYDFIEIYDTSQISICENIVSFFERSYIPKSSGLKAFNRNRQKVCATMTLNFGEDLEVNTSVYFL